MKILAVILLFAIIVIATFLGAISIASAIRNFKREKYFIFGVDIIVAIMFITTLIRIFVKLQL